MIIKERPVNLLIYSVLFTLDEWDFIFSNSIYISYCLIYNKE